MNLMSKMVLRGKRMDNEGWVWGDSSRYNDGVCEILMRERDSNNENKINESWQKVYSDTIGRFIGVEDKNNCMIFEGDIVRTKHGRLCIVRWKDTMCFIGFDLQPVGTRENVDRQPPDKWDLWHGGNLEVVGNVYDTPRLLGTYDMDVFRGRED